MKETIKTAREDKIVWEFCEDRKGPELTEKVLIPSFKKNREKYRSFVIKHANMLDDGFARNSDCIVSWAKERLSDDAFPYGNSGHWEECIADVLDGLGIACEFIPAGFEEIGLSTPDQKEDYILVEKSSLNKTEIRLLLEGNLNW